MTKKIGFIGNCQLGTLSTLYRRQLSEDSDTEVFYLPNYKEADDSQKRLVASADIVVRQILDFDQKIGAIETEAVEHLFPRISGAFLWPISGRAHPLNATFPYFDQGGPYPAEMGDLFLNKMIADKVAPETAVSTYLNSDLPAFKTLDRLKEMTLDKQRARDRACGYDFASIIDADFRNKSLFRTPGHPEVPLTMIMAAQLFERLEVDSTAIAKMVADPPGGLFPMSAAPIHPRVVDAFGLSFIQPGQRYRYFDEGSFTFEEYADRYMRFEWSPKLAEGLHWFRNGELDKALEALELGVVEAPRSAVGRFVLSDLLVKRSRIAEGLQRAREAVRLEPDNKHFQQRLEYFTALRSRLLEGQRTDMAPTANPAQTPVSEAAVALAAVAELSKPDVVGTPVAPEKAVSATELEILFGREGNAHAFQSEGWSNPETIHTWTTAQRASLRVPRISVHGALVLSFSATPYAPNQRPYQRVSVIVNDVRIAELFLEKPTSLSLWVPQDVVAKTGDALTIAFQIPDAAKPADFNPAATDTRQLGLAFTRMTIGPLPQTA